MAFGRRSQPSKIPSTCGGKRRWDDSKQSFQSHCEGLSFFSKLMATYLSPRICFPFLLPKILKEAERTKKTMIRERKRQTTSTFCWCALRGPAVQNRTTQMRVCAAVPLRVVFQSREICSERTSTVGVVGVEIERIPRHASS